MVNKLWKQIYTLPIQEQGLVIDGQVFYIIPGRHQGAVELGKHLVGWGFSRPGFGVEDPADNDNKHLVTKTYTAANGWIHTITWNMDLGGHIFEWEVDLDGVATIQFINHGNGSGRGLQVGLFFADPITWRGRNGGHITNMAGTIRADPVADARTTDPPPNDWMLTAPSVGFDDEVFGDGRQVVKTTSVPLDWGQTGDDDPGCGDAGGDANTAFIWKNMLHSIILEHPFRERGNIWKCRGQITLLADQAMGPSVATLGYFLFGPRYIFQDYYIYDASDGTATKLSELEGDGQASPPPSPPRTFDDLNKLVSYFHNPDFAVMDVIGEGTYTSSPIFPSHGKHGMILRAGDSGSARQQAWAETDNDFCVGLFTDHSSLGNLADTWQWEWGRNSVDDSPNITTSKLLFDNMSMTAVVHFQPQTLPKGDYFQDYYIVIGTFAQVKTEMDWLYNNL